MYYHHLITEKSWQILKELRIKYDFILIGGWAVFLYTKTLKSKDIDIVIDFKTLGKFKLDFDVVKNERLKKYEIKKEGIDIDIYLEFYSNPGLPAEEIKKYRQKIEGFNLPKPEILLILKQKAYLERQGSIKGEKDKIDIFSLLNYSDFDFFFYQKILKDYQLNYLDNLKELLKKTVEIKDLGLNSYQVAKLKKKIKKELFI